MNIFVVIHVTNRRKIQKNSDLSIILQIYSNFLFIFVNLENYDKPHNIDDQTFQMYVMKNLHRR